MLAVLTILSVDDDEVANILCNDDPSITSCDLEEITIGAMLERTISAGGYGVVSALLKLLRDLRRVHRVDQELHVGGKPRSARQAASSFFPRALFRSTRSSISALNSA